MILMKTNEKQKVFGPFFASIINVLVIFTTFFIEEKRFLGNFMIGYLKKIMLIAI